jgi:hypothetical protein
MYDHYLRDSWKHPLGAQLNIFLYIPNGLLKVIVSVSHKSFKVIYIGVKVVD